MTVHHPQLRAPLGNPALHFELTRLAAASLGACMNTALASGALCIRIHLFKICTHIRREVGFIYDEQVRSRDSCATFARNITALANRDHIER